MMQAWALIGATLAQDARMPRSLHSLRIDAGLSMEALAARAGVSRNTIWRIEQGGYRPYPSTSKRVADALGCVPSDVAEFAADGSLHFTGQDEQHRPD